MHFVTCPHCGQFIEIVELNCRIFRCGVMKDSFQQIDPHLSKENCDQLVSKKKIYGCGNPFYAHDVSGVSSNSILCLPCDYI